VFCRHSFRTNRNLMSDICLFRLYIPLSGNRITLNNIKQITLFYVNVIWVPLAYTLFDKPQIRFSFVLDCSLELRSRCHDIYLSLYSACHTPVCLIKLSVIWLNTFLCVFRRHRFRKKAWFNVWHLSAQIAHSVVWQKLKLQNIHLLITN